MERDSVVGVTRQGAQAVVMLVTGVGILKGVGDGLGENRVWADLDERAVGGAGGGDGVAEPDRVAQIGHPVVGIELCCLTGVLDG